MRFRKGSLVVLVLAMAVSLSATDAYAGGKGGGGNVGGGNVGGGTDDGGTSIDAHAHAYEVTYSPAAVPQGHPLAATTQWTPPPCWMAPVADPQELKTEREGVWAEESTGYVWDQKQRDYYVNGHPHKDFEIAESGKGMWWNGQVNPNRLADPASTSCFKEYDDWVLNGRTPPPGPGPTVTPEILAESAYDRLRVPDKVVELSPDAQHTQTVNLNTWAWLTKSDIHPVSVTARLASLGIWARTTAEPVGLHLEPGTPDADVYPASGDCPLNPDGSVGRPYTRADGNDVPPCGLTYRRSSGSGTFPLSATIRWKVTWTGSGGTGGDLPGGTFEFNQDVTVQDIQSVNR